MSAKSPLQIFLLSSTHWDREWYLPFQAFRFKLAENLDEVLDVMENQPEFRLFCMDGQTIILNDYVEAVPENRERLQKLIDDGRIKIGPWYVMPDTRLISGESIIFNFLMGRRVSERWNAETWKYGYMCDIFGHIAQMPQIMNGFGFTGSYLGRGIRPEWRGLFRWQGPDGSEILTYYDSYGHFTWNISDNYGKPGYQETLRDFLTQRVERGTSPVIIWRMPRIIPVSHLRPMLFWLIFRSCTRMRKCVMSHWNLCVMQPSHIWIACRFVLGN